MNSNKSSEHHPDWIQSLPPVLLERIKLCAAERQVPIELALMVSLAAVAASVGAGVDVRSGKNRTTRSNLFVLLGVSSGIGKSEIFRDLLGPLMQFEQGLHDWWQEEPASKARAGEELLKARISSIRSDIRKFPTGNVIQSFSILQASELKRMICKGYLEPPSLLADDATSEALAQQMHRSHESIATVSPDARYFLKRLSSPDSKEESFFLKGFSGDLTLTNRISRNCIRLRNPCLSALLLTQRDAYRGFIQKSTSNRSGLLPRFLHGEINHTATTAIKVDRRSEGRIRSSYDRQLVGLIEAYRFETGSITINPSKEAAQYIDHIERGCRSKAAEDESLAGEVLRRRAEQIWRVSLCLHLIRHGNSSAIHELALEDAQSAAAITEKFTQLKPINHI